MENTLGTVKKYYDLNKKEIVTCELILQGNPDFIAKDVSEIQKKALGQKTDITLKTKKNLVESTGCLTNIKIHSFLIT